MEHCVWNKSKEENNIIIIVTIGGDLVQVLGGRGRRVSAENFLFVPPKCEIWGDGGGLTATWN